MKLRYMMATMLCLGALMSTEARPASAGSACEDPESMYQWRESDIGPDDYGHVGDGEYNRNVEDPNGEWFEDETKDVPGSEHHSNWEEGTIAGVHAVCFGEG